MSSLLNTYQYLSLDKEREKYARDAANTIFKKQAREIESPIESEYQMVNVNSLAIETPRSLGPEYLYHSIWRDLEMDKFLTEKGISEKVIPVMEALVAGRLISLIPTMKGILVNGQENVQRYMN